jgi:hypothetical protein
MPEEESLDNITFTVTSDNTISPDSYTVIPNRLENQYTHAPNTATGVAQQQWLSPPTSNVYGYPGHVIYNPLGTQPIIQYPSQNPFNQNARELQDRYNQSMQRQMNNMIPGYDEAVRRAVQELSDTIEDNLVQEYMEQDRLAKKAMPNDGFNIIY